MKTLRKRKLPAESDLVALAARSDIASIGSVVSRIMEIIRDPNSNAGDLRKIIEVDPPLSARLLRRANSAACGVKRNISSIQEAIVLLGFSVVRELSLSLKVARLFEGGEGLRGKVRKMLWKHSLAVALCCKYLYRREFKERGEGIYTAALLHDIGIIAEDQFAWEFLEEALALVAAEACSLLEAERQVFGFDHASLGGALVCSWRLPEELAKAVAWHHNPLGVDPRWLRATGSVFVCDFACRSAGLSLESPGGQESQERYAAVLRLLNLSPEAVELIAADVAAEIEDLEAKGELYL